MKKSRYKKLAYDGEGDTNTQDGIVREPSKVKIEENLPTVSAGEYAEFLSVYTDKEGNKAVVLPGWTVSGVSEENTIFGKGVSLVIYRIPKKKATRIRWENPAKLEKAKKTYDQLVWCPVEMLDANGTIDGQNFNEKFGRRNYPNHSFSVDGFNEPLEMELLEQCESVRKYGGFYISRYNISNAKSGKYQSVKGVFPCNERFSFEEVKAAATSFEDNEFQKSHLTYGCEYDSVLEWLLKSKVKTFIQIMKDSTEWGNYRNSDDSSRILMRTGSNEVWCANNIYDIAGNVEECTQERYEEKYYVTRGGNYKNLGNLCPVGVRLINVHGYSYAYESFRVTICIK